MAYLAVLLKNRRDVLGEGDRTLSLLRRSGVHDAPGSRDTECKGDDLRICYAPLEGDAPKAFEAKEGSKAHLFTLKRSK